jgi:hypothetical protein
LFFHVNSISVVQIIAVCIASKRDDENLLLLCVAKETTPFTIVNDCKDTSLCGVLYAGDLLFVPAGWQFCATMGDGRRASALQYRWSNSSSKKIDQQCFKTTENLKITEQGRIRIGSETNWREQRKILFIYLYTFHFVLSTRRHPAPALCSFCVSYHDEKQCPSVCATCHAAEAHQAGEQCPNADQFTVHHFSTSSVVAPKLLPLSDSNV